MNHNLVLIMTGFGKGARPGFRPDVARYPDLAQRWQVELCKQWDERTHPQRHRLAKVEALNNHSSRKGGPLCIDSAKNVFQAHGIDEDREVLVKQLCGGRMASLFVNFPPYLVGMKACSSTHHWARSFWRWAKPCV